MYFVALSNVKASKIHNHMQELLFLKLDIIREVILRVGWEGQPFVLKLGGLDPETMHHAEKELRHE